MTAAENRGMCTISTPFPLNVFFQPVKQRLQLAFIKNILVAGKPEYFLFQKIFDCKLLDSVVKQCKCLSGRIFRRTDPNDFLRLLAASQKLSKAVPSVP